MMDSKSVRPIFDAIMADRLVQSRSPHVMIVSTYFADTLKSIQQVYDRFGGRDRRRIKRELRKAGQAVARKHRGL